MRGKLEPESVAVENLRPFRLLRSIVRPVRHL